MSNIPALNQAQFLTLIRTALPERVYTLLLSGEFGEGILAAVAKVASVLSARKRRQWQDIYYLQGSRGAYATTTATVTWTGGTVAGVQLLEGQPVMETRWGLRFVLAEPLEAGDGEAVNYSQSVAIRSEYRTHEADVEARHLDQWPESLSEGVDPGAQVLWGAAVSDAGKAEFLAGVASGAITIQADADGSGGRLPLLDLLAQGQGVAPAENESDLHLALRMRRPRDVHSPDAILGAVNDLLEPFGVVATMEEPWTYAMAWGNDDLATGCGAWGVAPWGRRAFFVIVVPDWGYQADGFAWGAGAWGVHPWGSGDAGFEGVIQGLQQLVDHLTLAGVKGLVLSENPSVTP